MSSRPQNEACRLAVKTLLSTCEVKCTCPPWLRYPGTSKGHIFWRMGEGDYYRYTWEQWYLTLGTTERQLYRTAFPPPPSWNEPPHTYYDGVEDGDNGADTDNEAALVASHWDRTLWTCDGLPPRVSDASLFDVSLPAIHFTNEPVCTKPGATVDASCLSTRFCWAAEPTEPTELFHEGAHRLTDTFTSVQDYVVVRAQELRAERLALADVGDDALTARFQPNCGEFDRLTQLEESLAETLDRDVWSKFLFTAAAEANFLKFSQSEALRHYLLHTTGNAPLRCDDDNAPSPLTTLAAQTWPSTATYHENLFGNALMYARAAIRSVFAFEDVFSEEVKQSP